MASTMRRRTVQLVLLGVVVFALGFYFLRPRGPFYHGVALSAWLEDLGSQEPGKHDRAAEAVRHMGTTALPPLLRMLQAKDSNLKMKFKEFAEKQSVFEFHFRFAQEYHERATRAFVVLGPLAEPTIPSLIELLGDEDVEIRLGASSALNAIGLKAVFPLVNALTNANHLVRAEAAECLAFIGSDDPKIVPALIHNLNDKDSLVRASAACCLGEVCRNPTDVVPALIKSLQDPDSSVRSFSAGALRGFGDKAKPAVPALLKALQDPERIVRISATSSLLKIDPEAAAKAGAKIPVF